MTINKAAGADGNVDLLLPAEIAFFSFLFYFIMIRTALMIAVHAAAVLRYYSSLLVDELFSALISSSPLLWENVT